MGKVKGLKPATSIKVRHILTEKASASQAALEEIQNGSSFSSVAAKYSIDKARSGGSLGWMTRSGLVQEFSAVAFELEPSTTDKPIIGQVKTKFGYHLIMIGNDGDPISILKDLENKYYIRKIMIPKLGGIYKVEKARKF